MTPQELKNSILQLAIQGKLVDQRREEGTAEELYQQIQCSFTQEKGNKKVKTNSAIVNTSEVDFPFEIPESWKWVRLEQIGYTNIGLTYSPQNQTSYGTIVLRSSNIQDGNMDYDDIVRVSMDIPESKLCHIGDILICARNGSKRLVGKAAIIDQEGMSFGAFMAIYRSICNPYILHVINSAYFRNSLLGDTGTTTINQITQDMLKNALIPLPPLAEQQRIVAKIEELLPHIDRYEQAWRKLADFNKRFPTDMQKSILQMAIQGKLVEQRPEEGTGEELYQQIQAEKLRLIKAGTIRKEKPLSEIAEDEKPFDIPESWKWVRLNSICKSIADGDHQAPPQVPSGVPFLVISNLSSGVIDFSNTRYVPQEYFDNLSPERVAENGDLVFTVTGSYGITVKVDCVDRFCFQRHMALLKTLMDNEYLFYLLKSPLVKKQCDEVATGTAQKTVGLNSLRNIIIPLPTLAEQKRIVAKLKETLPLCEKLKK